MTQPTAVESLFIRLQISEHYAAFRDHGVDKIVTLRRMEETQLKELIPDEAAFKLLRDALNKAAEPSNSDRPARPDGDDDHGNWGGRGGGRGGRGGRGRGRGRGGDYHNNYHGDGEEGGDYDRENGDRRENRRPRGEYVETISVPTESVKLLLGNKAEKLHNINYRCGTTNSRIERPDSFDEFISFDLRGTKEGVEKARQEIEDFVGITSSKDREARFNYAKNELERNEMAVAYLLAANVLNKGTDYELSENVVQRVAKTFKFQSEPKITQFWVLSTSEKDKDKFETLMPLVKQMEGIQCIIFTEVKRVQEMHKRAKQTAEALGVKNPQFVHRDMSKEDRMLALEAFKKGEVNENGVLQRVLVTNNDYAKLARKVLIPYCNLVLHFSMPKNKEVYLHQSMCTGRKNRPGISLLFTSNYDAALQKEWSGSLPLQELSIREWEQAVKEVQYDKEDNQLTLEAADPPSDWRERIVKEAEEKARLKAAKKAERETAKTA